MWPFGLPFGVLGGETWSLSAAALVAMPETQRTVWILLLTFLLGLTPYPVVCIGKAENPGTESTTLFFDL